MVILSCININIIHFAFIVMLHGGGGFPLSLLKNNRTNSICPSLHDYKKDENNLYVYNRFLRCLSASVYNDTQR